MLVSRFVCRYSCLKGFYKLVFYEFVSQALLFMSLVGDDQRKDMISW